MTQLMPDVETRTAVRLVDVHRTFHRAGTQVHAVRGVTLSLAAGSFTAVMGPSGSGKSTLLTCAAGLETPTRGQVVVGGHDISTLSPDRLTRFRRDHIGFVFQAYNLVGHLSVAENVALPGVLTGRPTDPLEVHRLLELVGLPGLGDRLPGELSGGQAQRAAIARALVNRPTVLLADEPTGALDSGTAAQVLDLLRSTALRLGQTVVLVTHDPQVAAAADRVMFLADGLLVDQLEQPTAELVGTRMLGLGR